MMYDEPDVSRRTSDTGIGVGKVRVVQKALPQPPVKPVNSEGPKLFFCICSWFCVSINSIKLSIVIIFKRVPWLPKERLAARCDGYLSRLHRAPNRNKARSRDSILKNP